MGVGQRRVALVERLPAATRHRMVAARDPDDLRRASCGAQLPGAGAVCPRCSPPDEVEEPAPGYPSASLGSPAASVAAPPAATWWAVAAGLPNAREDHRRIQELYQAARFTAWSGLIVLPWISGLVAFRQASRALALVRTYGADEHPLERRIERLRWFALAYGAAAWLALAAWLLERHPF